MRFRTKVDLWLALLVGGALLAGFVAVIATGDWYALPVVLIADVVIAFVCFPCDYTLTESGLHIRSGFMRWRIPYQDIDRVYPTRSLLSSPAWSLDRLAIVYGKKWVLISPEGQDEFLALLSRGAGLSQSGVEFVREANQAH